MRRRTVYDHKVVNIKQKTDFSIDLIGKQMNKHLKDIHYRNKCLVFGYMRYYALFRNNLHIPSSLIHYVLLYLYFVVENWSKCTIANQGTLMIQHKLIQKMKRCYKWENVFGTKNISMNTGIHEWTIKLTAEIGTARWVLFGIVPSQIVDHFDIKQHERESVQWIINDYIKGYALHLGNGVFFDNGYEKGSCAEYEGGKKYIRSLKFKNNEAIVTMIFDTNNKTLRYTFNGDIYENAMNNVKETDYKVGVSLLSPCKLQFLFYKHTV